MRAPEFWSDRNSLLAAMLAPLGWGYHFGGVIQRASATPWRAPVPVICVGNLTAGGTGKTPVSMALAEKLKATGKNPHFLTRGYGGSIAGPVLVDPAIHKAAEVGDEALLLAASAPTWVSADRKAGASAAAEAGANIIIMDDGFQNPSLHKNISLLVVDGGAGFGNGHMVPAGPLRETVSGGLERASGVIIIGDDATGVSAQIGAVPLIKARFVPGAEAADLKSQKVVAFAGIGRPEKFYQSLREAGCDLVETFDFPDHHAFKAEEVEAVLTHAATLKARPVTTAKDAVRLSDQQREKIDVLTISLQWENEETLDNLLEGLTA